MDREQAFNEQLVQEVTRNKNAIREILDKSKVGECDGKCKGYGEQTPDDLCDQCRVALEKNADEIFSASTMMRLLGDAMNSRD